jgi:hypothetical protein
MIRRFPVCVLLAAVLFAACEKKPIASTGSPVLAKAGDEVITVADFEKEVQRRLAKHLPVPDKAVLMEEMLVRLAAVARAKQAKLHDDAETKREMENVLIAKLRAQELEAKVNALAVTEEELKAAFDAAAGGLARPAKVRLAILHLQADGKMSDAKKAELRTRMEDGLKKAAESPAEGGRGAAATGFGAVAVEYSDDQSSRYRGGDIGWLDAGNFSYRWPRVALEAGYALEKGQRSGIIETDTGLFVMMKTDARDGAVASFEEAQHSLRRELLAKKRAAIEADFLSDNRTLTGAEIRTGVLSSVTLPPTPAKAGPVAESTPPALPGMNPTSR